MTPRGVVIAGAVAVNVVLLAYLATWGAWMSPDWQAFAFVPASHPYDPLTLPSGIPSMWRYSPVALWVMQPAAIAVGQFGWAVLHGAALALLPRRVAVIVALSFPFWVDLVFGNVFTFVMVAGFWAMRGNRAGVVAYLVLTLLMPRPVQLPLAAWLLWREPWVRVPFAAVFAVHAGLVAWSGLGPAWVTQLATNRDDMTSFANASPSRWFGYAWLVVGIPAAVVAWRRGRPGLAGLLASPYLLPQYWLMLVVDPPLWRREATPEPALAPVTASP